MNDNLINNKPLQSNNLWPYLLISPSISFVIAVLANLLSAYLINKVFYTAFSPLRLWIIIAFTIFGIIIGIWIERVQIKFKFSIMGSYFLIIFFIFLAIAGACDQCQYHGETDAESIINIIKEEGIAVRREDLGKIQEIFAKDAVIADVSNNKTWLRDFRYSTLFENTTFLEANQFEIQPVEIGFLRNRAVFTSGSRGAYRISGEDSTYEYYNKAGSNEWTLKKNECGCWVIKKFRFNIPVK